MFHKFTSDELIESIESRDETIKRLRKQINQLKEELKKSSEWREKWQAYFNQFMIRFMDIDITNLMDVRAMMDELSIQLEAFMGW